MLVEAQADSIERGRLELGEGRAAVTRADDPQPFVTHARFARPRLDSTPGSSLE